MPKLKLAANFIAKEADLKTSATTAVTRFPLEQVRNRFMDCSIGIACAA